MPGARPAPLGAGRPGSASTRERKHDELEAIEAEIAAAKPVVAAARAAGLDDAAIGRIHDEAVSTEYGSGWAAVTKATQEVTEKRRVLADEQQRKRRKLADLTAKVRATSTGAKRLEETRRARLDTTKRSLTLDEEASVVTAVAQQIEEKLKGLESRVIAAGGEALLRNEQRKRADQGAQLPLAAREQAVNSVAQQLDEAERRRAARRETLFGRLGGRELYFAWLAAVAPGWQHRGKPSDAQVDQALEAAGIGRPVGASGRRARGCRTRVLLSRGARCEGKTAHTGADRQGVVCHRGLRVSEEHDLRVPR